MTQDLGIFSMLGIYSLVILPLFIIWKLEKILFKKAVIALLRMTGQLLFIGLYLKYLFQWNSWLVNCLWILIMLGIANWSTLESAGLNRKKLFMASFYGTAFASLTVGLFFIGAIVRPTPIFDAMYLIPVFGMILGNCMRGNVMALERYFNDIHAKKAEIYSYYTLGANFKEATRPFYTRALGAAVGPSIATMATMGIVSLPGMMTGQILGGASALVAIKYQLAIMICIFTTLVFGAALNIYFCNKIAFDAWGNPKEDILLTPKSKS